MRTTTILLTMPLLATLFSAGCGGGGGGGGAIGPGPVPPPTQPPTVVITALRVSGTMNEPATVTVKGVADGDGVVDQAFRVDFALDGGAGPSSLPVDPGATAAASDLALTIVATDSAANARTKSLVVTLNP